MPESPSSPVDPSPGPSHASDGSRHVSLAQTNCSLEGVSLRAATGSRRGAYQLRASNGVIHAKRLVKVGVVAAGGRIDAPLHLGDDVVFLLPTETWVVLVEPVRRVAIPRGPGFAEVHSVVAAAGPVPPVVVRCQKCILGVLLAVFAVCFARSDVGSSANTRPWTNDFRPVRNTAAPGLVEELEPDRAQLHAGGDCGGSGCR